MRIALAILFSCSLAIAQDRIESYRVIDGDTVRARIEVWPTMFIDASIRLNGYSAPELNEPGGLEAKKAFEDFMAAGKVRTVVPTGKRSFERYVGDVFVDGQSASECLREPVASAVEPLEMSAAVDWNTAIQAELDAAGIAAKQQNKSITVVVPEGQYEFVSLSIPPHVSLVSAPSAVRAARLVYTGGNDGVLINVKGDLGYGSRISGFEILAKYQSAARLTAIKLNNCINAEVDHVRVDLRGQDCIALDVSGKESLSVDTVELRAARPLWIRGGDNANFHNCDFGCFPNCSSGFASSVVVIDSQVAQFSFDGYQTWQGGTHAVLSNTTAASTGQGLAIYNLRWEQSTSTQDPTKYAIDITCNGRAFENLVLVNCRWTQRKSAIRVNWNPGFPLVPTITTIGCWIPGSK